MLSADLHPSGIWSVLLITLSRRRCLHISLMKYSGPKTSGACYIVHSRQPVPFISLVMRCGEGHSWLPISSREHIMLFSHLLWGATGAESHPCWYYHRMRRGGSAFECWRL
ncbi:hypothetical protein GGR52DRAFT_562271 [Hypoxylon sp. FL1284]|nr:hypothetical protein GGR52DRAFT_562271 [Hypoxylon sp. FL1284]